MKALFVLGTRPEAIKLAPVILAARRRNGEFQTVVASTGQHRELLDSALEFFAVRPDHDLELMAAGQTLAQLTARLVESVDGLLRRVMPDVVVVQGDTTTAMATAMAAFYLRIPVAHVEAGLRTDRADAPFPEEVNRRVIGQVARWHLAPTPQAKACLLRDNVHLLGGRIWITGNTVIDALLLAAERVRQSPPADPDCSAAARWKMSAPERRIVLVTGHRRENFGEPFEQFCLALRDIARESADTLVVYPVHLNPNVQTPVRAILGNEDNVRLTDPKGYADFVRLMLDSHFVITDSGGVQEEAPALGRPVLVTRDTTERPEAVAAGVARLVGTDRTRIATEAVRLLTDPDAYSRMARGSSPYGDGRAADRCLDVLLARETTEFVAGC